MLSCKEKYIYVSLCAYQAAWMMNLLDKIKGKDHGTMIMIIDNMYAINMTKNLIAHGRSKHIEVRFHY